MLVVSPLAATAAVMGAALGIEAAVSMAKGRLDAAAVAAAAARGQLYG